MNAELANQKHLADFFLSAALLLLLRPQLLLPPTRTLGMHSRGQRYF
jgi:hypothetical protein